MKKENIKLIKIIAVVMLIINFTILGGYFIYNEYKDEFSYFYLLKDESLRDFIKIYKEIDENYMGDIKKSEMIDAASEAMLDSLGDEYTSYLTKSEKESFDLEIAGTFKGIGVTIKGLEILSLVEKGPAEQSGIKVGDIIVEVNNQEITEETSDLISVIIQNFKKEKINIKVKRDKEILSFNVKLTDLDLSTSASMIDDTNIGYIAINVFSNNVYDSFRNNFMKLKEQGMEKLIIDLRNNGGGLLDKSVEISSMFLEKNEIIVTLEKDKEKITYKDKTKEYINIPIVILQNSQTASASEILIAALKDHEKAIVVGEKSFGKGKVQEIINTNSGAMKYTTSFWYTPNNECIDKLGIIPDYEEKLKYIENEKGEIIEIIDSQLLKALEIINE